jgi:hypothetical protein
MHSFQTREPMGVVGSRPIGPTTSGGIVDSCRQPHGERVAVRKAYHGDGSMVPRRGACGW